MRRTVVLLALIGGFGGRAAAQVPVGPPFRVNTYVNGYQFASSAAVLHDGSFLVVWTSTPQDGSDNGIYAQHYGAAGTPSGAEFRVNTFTTGSQGLPVVAALAGGGAVVAFSSDEPPAGIRARV